MPEVPLKRRQPSFDLAELIGRKTEDARQRCECDGFRVQVFFLSCVIVAGVYGAVTANVRILAAQALPGALALGAVLLAR